MDNQGVTAQTDAAATTGRTPRAARLSGLFGSEARQKLLAFASLILLLIYFSFASPAFMQTDNMINILQATAVNGVLAIASTFIIITAGIDLSVGTLMTFYRGDGRRVSNLLGPADVDRRARRDRDGRNRRFDLRDVDREAEDPALHRHARLDAGVERAFPGRRLRQADLFQRHRELLSDLAGFADRLCAAMAADPQRRFDPFRCWLSSLRSS